MMIFIPGTPRGKGRPRFTRYGKPYTDTETRKYEDTIAEAYRTQGAELIADAPVQVMVEVFFKIPERTSKKRTFEMLRDLILPAKKPDLDNVIKAVLDALNGVAYRDDSQVCWLFARKVYGSNEGVRIAVEEMEGNNGK